MQHVTDWRLLHVGDKASSQIKITEEYIKKFVKLSGDDNPIHVDHEYAANTVFKKCIGHGLIGLSEISKIIGTVLPGPGSVFISENISYLNPIYIDDVVTTEVKISEIKLEKEIIKMKACSYNQNNIGIISGELVIKML